MKSKLHALGILVLLGLVAYCNFFKNSFQYDDAHIIISNPYIRSLKFIPDYFVDGRTSSSLPENSGYRPLVTLWSALCFAVDQGAGWFFHLAKLVEHILVAFLIFLIGTHLIRGSPKAEETVPIELWVPRKIFGRDSLAVTPEAIAFFAAALFLVHPSNSESVNYIASISSVQCGLFYLLALWLAIESENRPLWLFGMAASLFCSLLTKEEGVTFPATLAAYYFIYRDRYGFGPEKNWKAWLWNVIPPIGVAAITTIFFLGLYVTLKPSSSGGSWGGIAIHHYFFTQVWAWVYYLSWIFMPWGYAIEHMEFGLSSKIYEPRVMAGFILNGLLIFCAVWLTIKPGLAKRFQAVAFGLVWYYLTLLPASSVFPLTEPINEHRYYISYTLLFAALAYAIAYALGHLHYLVVEWNFAGRQTILKIFSDSKRAKTLTGFVVVVLGLLTSITLYRNTIWASELNVWNDVIAKDPTNGRAYNNAGIVYLGKGDFDKALEYFENCAKYWGAYKYCYLNLHIVYKAKNEMDKARKAIQTVMSLDPNFVTGLWYKASFELYNEKKPNDAIQTLQTCDRIASGKSSQCLDLLMRAYKDAGDQIQFQETAKRVLEISPGNREVMFSLGLNLIDKQKWSEAKQLFNDVFTRDPRDAQAAYNLAWLEMQPGGDLRLSRELWLKTLQLNPDAEGSWLNLRSVGERLSDAETIKKANEGLHRIKPQAYPAP